MNALSEPEQRLVQLFFVVTLSAHVEKRVFSPSKLLTCCSSVVADSPELPALSLRV
jgi:hypothetical protein